MNHRHQSVYGTKTSCIVNSGPKMSRNCGSRQSYEDHIPWTWQDGRLLALALSLVGLAGALLNSLVLLGVSANAKLGTTVNKLLAWICIMALLESTLGVTLKSLILGK